MTGTIKQQTQYEYIFFIIFWLNKNNSVVVIAYSKEAFKTMHDIYYTILRGK